MEILVVDNDRKTRVLLSKIIFAIGHECLIVRRKEQALSALKNKYIPIVICNLNMLGMDARVFLMEVKKVNSNIDVIYIAGRADECISENLMRIGVGGFLHKPISKKELEEVLSKIIREKKLVQKIQEAIRQYKKIERQHVIIVRGG